MTRALSNRVKKMERNPTVVKAIEYRRELEFWEGMVKHYLPYVKRLLAMEKYTGNPNRPEVIADDIMEFEIMAVYKLMDLHPTEAGENWPWEVEQPVRREIHRELLLRWYGVRRTPDEEKEGDLLSEQMVKDLDAGVPPEQSEAAAYFKRWFEQHPRRSYRYYELDRFKPKGWQWRLEELGSQG